MSLDVFLGFDGDCEEAVRFYAGVFGLPVPVDMMRYGQTPGGGLPGVDKDRILYAMLPIFGGHVMFSDCPSGPGHVKGTNFALTLGTGDEGEIEQVFAGLSQGGQVLMPLGKTFFSEFYGMVTDRFGITWQLSKTPFDS